MGLTIDGRALAALTDEELEQERIRRRRARGQSEPTERKPADRWASLRERWRQEKATVESRDDPRAAVQKAYSNLELPEGASLSEVRRQYRAMMRRYDPAKHKGDAEKQEAAESLVRGLTRAYQTLLAHLER